MNTAMDTEYGKVEISPIYNDKFEATSWNISFGSYGKGDNGDTLLVNGIPLRGYVVVRRGTNQPFVYSNAYVRRVDKGLLSNDHPTQSQHSKLFKACCEVVARFLEETDAKGEVSQRCAAIDAEMASVDREIDSVKEKLAALNKKKASLRMKRVHVAKGGA
jgi:hypothetical protein